jgi:peptidoglycan-associated lipoprotein
MRKPVVAHRLLGVTSLLAAALLVVGAPGCAGKKKPEPTPAAAPQPEAPPPALSLSVEATPPAPPAPPPPPPPPPTPPCVVLRDALSGMRVHFAVDKSDLSKDAAVELDGVAGTIRNSKLGPGIDINVEGHCDSTGTDGYNVALGERRANTVLRRLVDLGVINPAHAKAISWGEQRPLDPAQTPDAYTKNRRAEFVVSCPAN